jgi:hypothetical protein
LQWYTKKSKVDLKAAQDAERREIKLKEQDLMLQMLYVYQYFLFRATRAFSDFSKSAVGKSLWSLLRGLTLTGYKRTNC